MHMLIRALVYAEDSIDALTRAKEDVFQPLIGTWGFDYYVTADMDGRDVAGTDRWGEYPAAVAAASTPGQELIQNGCDATVDAYTRQFDQVQEFLDSPDQEAAAFWEDGAVHREYHHAFHAIGEYRGPHTWLYDQDGAGILNRGHLDSVQNHWEDVYSDETPYDTELYVVPGDVHY